MNICYLYLHRFAGSGSGRYMKSTVSYLRDRGNSIYVVEGLRSKLSMLRGLNVKYVHFPFQVPVYVARSDVKENVKIRDVPDSQLVDIINRFAEWEVRINEKVGLDIVHASHASVLPFAACVAKRICGVPYVVTVHGSGMASSLENERNMRIASRGLEDADKIIANSDFLKRGVLKNFSVPQSKVEVIYPSVDTAEFSPASGRIVNAVKRRYGCEGKKVILASGFFEERAGFQHIIEAAAIYEKEDPDIVTIITGRGEYQSEMERKIKAQGLRNTKMLGWLLQKDIAKLFSAADLFVTSPNWEEYFGLVPVEALSAGTPVIASKVGWLPEIVDSSVGELVEPRSPEAIAKAVLDRIHDEKWLDVRGKAGRERALSHFSQAVSGNAMEKVYERFRKKP
jgi:glycosyltransferase involved in cell wall biosynthesis